MDGDGRTESSAGYTVARKRGGKPGLADSVSGRNPHESSFSFSKQLSKPRVILLFIMAITSCTFLDMVTTDDDDKDLAPGLNRKSLHFPLHKRPRWEREKPHILDSRHGAPRPPRDHSRAPPHDRSSPPPSKSVTHEGTNGG
eukprot:6887309-Pyramimonas_sp.AAC.1